MENKKRIVLIIPSDIIAKGFEGILAEQGDFLVQENLVDFSRGSEAKLRNLSPDVVIVDPAVFDFQSRKESRILIADCCDASVLALEGPSVTDDILKQFDGAISLYDDMACVARKINSALDSKQPDLATEGNELSVREKEILVCVAQGMLNKEIADKFSLSIYTVITHRKNITRKTGIKTVAGLTVYAILNNLIDINSVQ